MRLVRDPRNEPIDIICTNQIPHLVVGPWEGVCLFERGQKGQKHTVHTVYMFGRTPENSAMVLFRATENVYNFEFSPVVLSPSGVHVQTFRLVSRHTCSRLLWECF